MNIRKVVNMTDDLKTTPLVDLISELTILEQEIGLKTIRYNNILEELYFRFPKLREQSEFQQIESEKVKVKK